MLRGLTLQVLFSLIVLLLAFRASKLYYSENLPTFGDGVYYLAMMGETIRTSKVEGSIPAIRQFLTNERPQTALHYLTTSLLGKFLPLDYSLSVILNGIWYLVLSISLYLLFWRLSETGVLAFAFSIPLLTVTPFLSDVRYGLTDLNVNLIGYTIGGSAICWTLMSDRFRRFGPAAVAGLLLGLLTLGRIFVLGLLFPALLPVGIAGLACGSNDERRRTGFGMVICLVVMLAVSGWWALPKVLYLSKHYIGIYGKSGAVIGVSTYLSNFRAWRSFLSSFLLDAMGSAILVLFTWRLGAAVLKASGPVEFLKRVNWLYLWMGLAPLAILVSLKTFFWPYGTLSFFGIYLALMFPVGPHSGETDSLLKYPPFRWSMLAVGVFLACVFLRFMFLSHGQQHTSKVNAMKAVEAILADAAATNINEVDIELTTHGNMGIGNLCNLLIFDTCCSVSSGFIDLAPSTEGMQCPQVRILSPFRHYMLARTNASGRREEEIISGAYDDVVREADYFIIMGPHYITHHPDKMNVELTKRLLESEDFQQITGALKITDREDIMVLARADRN
jgi:hypothetical protein